jgi:hypothetical protein
MHHDVISAAKQVTADGKDNFTVMGSTGNVDGCPNKSGGIGRGSQSLVSKSLLCLTQGIMTNIVVLAHFRRLCGGSRSAVLAIRAAIVGTTSAISAAAASDDKGDAKAKEQKGVHRSMPFVRGRCRLSHWCIANPRAGPISTRRALLVGYPPRAPSHAPIVVKLMQMAYVNLAALQPERSL